MCVYCRVENKLFPAGIKILGTFPESSFRVLTSETYTGLSGDQYKIWSFNEKNVFRTNSPSNAYLFLFLQAEEILKSFKQGRTSDVYGTQLRDVWGPNVGR